MPITQVCAVLPVFIPYPLTYSLSPAGNSLNAAEDSTLLFIAQESF